MDQVHSSPLLTWYRREEGRALFTCPKVSGWYYVIRLHDDGQPRITLSHLADNSKVTRPLERIEILPGGYVDVFKAISRLIEVAQLDHVEIQKLGGLNH